MTFDEHLKESTAYFQRYLKNGVIPKHMRKVSYAKMLLLSISRMFPEYRTWQHKKLVAARYGCDSWFELMCQLEALEYGKPRTMK